jgi:tRNA nucleotidyltransferase (CCA-adding enzyme)
VNVASIFQSYLSSLELTDRERADASAQQVALRDRLRLHLAGFVDSRLVGSYRRGTAIRPLKDIDVFVVLDARQHRRDVPEAPLRLLQTIERALRASYPSHQPRIQGRSVNIGFSGTGAAQVAQAAVDAERKGDGAAAIARWRSLLGDVFR